MNAQPSGHRGGHRGAPWRLKYWPCVSWRHSSSPTTRSSSVCLASERQGSLLAGIHGGIRCLVAHLRAHCSFEIRRSLRSGDRGHDIGGPRHSPGRDRGRSPRTDGRDLTGSPAWLADPPEVLSRSRQVLLAQPLCLLAGFQGAEGVDARRRIRSGATHSRGARTGCGPIRPCSQDLTGNRGCRCRSPVVPGSFLPRTAAGGDRRRVRPADDGRCRFAPPPGAVVLSSVDDSAF